MILDNQIMMFPIFSETAQDLLRKLLTHDVRKLLLIYTFYSHFKDWVMGLMACSKLKTINFLKV